MRPQQDPTPVRDGNLEHRWFLLAVIDGWADDTLLTSGEMRQFNDRLTSLAIQKLSVARLSAGGHDPVDKERIAVDLASRILRHYGRLKD